MGSRKPRTRYLLSTILAGTIAVLTSLVVVPPSFAATVVGEDGLTVDVSPNQVVEADADGFTLTITDDNLSGADFDSYQVSGIPTGWSVVVDGGAAEVVSPDPLIYSIPRAHSELRVVAPADYVGTLSGVKIARDTNGPNLVTDFDNGTFDYLGESMPQIAANTIYAWDDPSTVHETAGCNPATPYYGPCDGQYTIWPTTDFGGPDADRYNNLWADVRSIDDALPNTGATSSDVICGADPMRSPATNLTQVTTEQSAASGKVLMMNGSMSFPTPHDLISTTVNGLEPGATYTVKGHVTNISYSAGNVLPVQSAFYVTDSEETKNIGSSLPIAKQSSCLTQDVVWGQNVGTFVADSLGTATIGLRNYAAGGFGNDFAVDNLSLVKMASVAVDLVVFDTPAPGLSLDKDYVVVDDANGNGINDSGDVIAWTFEVTNTGNVALENVVVDDPLLDELGLAITCDPTSLAAGESATCRSEDYTITEADAEAGEIHNVATATGNVTPGTPGDPGDPVSPPDEVIVPTEPTPAPGIVLDKGYVLVDDANGNGINDSGDVIAWTFDVTNTGNVALENVVVDDPLLQDLGIDVICDPAPLAPGESVLCRSGDYTITEADVEAGEIHNVATATGTVPPGTPGDPEDPVSPPDEVIVPTEPTPTPAIALEKDYVLVDDANDNGINDAGDVVKWTFAVTNTGNVPLDDVRVVDPLLDELGVAITCDPTSLAVGESAVCESENYTITQADAEAGEIHNVATATGTVPPETPGDPEDPVSPPDEVIIPTEPTPAPGIALDKDYVVVDDANDNGINDPGDVIAWTFEVTNTGNVALDDVRVQDPLLDDLGLAITCDPTSLAAGESATCRSENYTITEADAEAGEILNVATATGTVPPETPGDPEDPVSPPDEVIVPTEPTPAPALSLDKDYVLVDDANDNGISDPGDVVKWTFAVTNTGNVPLDDVRVVDPLLDELGVAITCDPTSLAAGESAVCESENYTITQVDALAGEIHNIATATGAVPPETPGDPEDPVSPPDEVVIPLEPLVAGLELVKSAQLNDTNGNGWADAGETIDYSFDLTSTGTAALTDVFVDDPMLTDVGIAVECPQTTLAPGESMTCHAVKGYTVTEQDAEDGQVYNAATGYAEVPDNVEPIDPPESDVTTPADEATYLASTGGSSLGIIGGAAALLVVAGGVLLLARRMKRPVIEA